jgi:hypothetical protein
MNGCSSLTCGLQKSAGRIFGVQCTRWPSRVPSRTHEHLVVAKPGLPLTGHRGDARRTGVRSSDPDVKVSGRGVDPRFTPRAHGTTEGVPGRLPPASLTRCWRRGPGRPDEALLVLSGTGQGKPVWWPMVPPRWCPVGDNGRQRHERHGEGSSSRGHGPAGAEGQRLRAWQRAPSRRIVSTLAEAGGS